MPTNKCHKLADLDLLRKAWHLARDDARDDFMHDPFRYSDFAARLDDHLNGIRQALLRGSYQARPILTIDVPKSSLSVRPGSVLEIEDRIVLFAITMLIGPKLDKKLPKGVYSWRVKKNWKGGDLFTNQNLLEFPFLKGKTIRRRLDLVEPWYEAWPSFMDELVYEYEKQGYSFLVVSDIAAYFENIDLLLLRDILMKHLPKHQEIINFLYQLLQAWTWPCIGGANVGRGIPQGNGVSSFLGNIYLLPLDEAFESFAKDHDIRYLRYMDDVKILARDRKTAREALFLMNEQLRRLRLNLQGSKTRILEGVEIRDTFLDDRLDKVNDVIEQIQKNTKQGKCPSASNFATQLSSLLRSIKKPKRILADKDLRLFRRLLTAFALLRHSKMVSPVLHQLEINPDQKLLDSAVRYLRVQKRNLETISRRITHLLADPELLFFYQEARLFEILAFMRNIPSGAWSLALGRAKRTKAVHTHWYVRQRAALLLALKPLTKRELRTIVSQYRNEQEIEVKRAWVKVLAQLERDHFLKVARELVFSVEPKLQRLGRFCYLLLEDENKGKEDADSLFRDFDEDRLIDRMFEVEILSKSKHDSVRNKLLARLKENAKSVKRPIVRKRLEAIITSLSSKN